MFAKIIKIGDGSSVAAVSIYGCCEALLFFNVGFPHKKSDLERRKKSIMYMTFCGNLVYLPKNILLVFRPDTSKWSLMKHLLLKALI